MNFREAHITDAETIAALHRDSWRRTYRGMLRDEFLDSDLLTERLRLWHKRLSSSPHDQCVLIAEQEGSLQGFVCVFGERGGHKDAFLDNLHVRMEMHCHGVGKELMCQAGEWVRMHYPQASLYLWVFEANYQARRFYERLGGEIQGREIQAAPGGGNVVAVRYGWENIETLLALNSSDIKSLHIQ